MSDGAESQEHVPDDSGGIGDEHRRHASDLSSDSGHDRAARQLTVHGDVQGVFFRDSTRQEAQRLGVAGWVRNVPDGTVEALLEGPPDAVSDLETWIRDGGPRRASVEHVDARDTEPTGRDDFEVG